MRNGLASALEISARILRESTSQEEVEQRLEDYRVRSGRAMSESPTGYSCDFHDVFANVIGLLNVRRPRE